MNGKQVENASTFLYIRVNTDICSLHKTYEEKLHQKNFIISYAEFNVVFWVKLSPSIAAL